ncbi:MAG: ribonuclease H-like domain-containing protein [Clostridia bacterium]|nr:ribonuclease H-like domain-containing protein [Clostridia bacterium]
MDKLLDYLKLNASKLFESIKIVNISYNKATNSLVVKVVYLPEFDFNQDCKNQLCDLINKFLSLPGLKIDIKCKKSIVDDSVARELVEYYLNKYYASIFTTMQKNDLSFDIAENNVRVNIKVVNIFKDYLHNKNFEIDLKTFLEKTYFQLFEVKLYSKEESSGFSEELDESAKLFEEKVQSDFAEIVPVTYELINLEDYLGAKTENIALASTSLTPSHENITVAGTISFITKKTFISKRKSSNGEEKEYFNFVLNDNYGKVNCVYFPPKDSKEKFEELTDGMVIAVVGDAEEFNGRMNFKVKGIAKCELPEKEVVEVEQKFENEEYLFVKPEPYVSLAQATLFDVEVVNTNKFLKENDCVVFDVETTGLDANTCEIIEFGAVKVRDGKMIETFSCLLKPSEPIPDEIIELTGITNEMVANCYGIKDVLQDFYKFTRDSVLVAYNIAFDYKFIYLAGAAQGYKFDNQQIDAMVLAKNKLKGIKNYKLKTVATALNVSLEGAHRAVNDAIATAEVFVKLVDSDTVL